MVKGISRRVVVVDSPDQRFFEQAIFIVRNDAAGEDVTRCQRDKQGAAVALPAPAGNQPRLFHAQQDAADSSLLDFAVGRNRFLVAFPVTQQIIQDLRLAGGEPQPGCAGNDAPLKYGVGLH